MATPKFLRSITLPLGAAVCVAIVIAAGVSVANSDRSEASADDVTSAQIQAAQAQDSSGLAPSIAAAQRANEENGDPGDNGEQPPPTAPNPGPSSGAAPIYFNDFSSTDDQNRIDSFVQYRDAVVQRHDTGVSDHGSTGGVNCTAPEETRSQIRERPQDHVYQCHPGGDPAKGHMMGFAMDTTGYGFVGGLPDQVFEGVKEFSVDINTTSAGSRNFVELKVLPAGETYVNAMPCGPDLPCNDGWDYDDIGGIGASTNSQRGTGLTLNTPAHPDGIRFDAQRGTARSNGDIHYRQCDAQPSHCFRAHVWPGNTGIRARYKHTLRDNGDGTISFGIFNGEVTEWITSPGSFPDGPVRVVVAFHNYTGTKAEHGAGYDNNVSPSRGGFTWHWDNLAVVADKATPSEEFFGGNSPDRIVVPDGCIAFSQGQRNTPHSSNIEPHFEC